MKRIIPFLLAVVFLCQALAGCTAPVAPQPQAPSTDGGPAKDGAAAPEAAPQDAAATEAAYTIKLAHVGDLAHHYQFGGEKFKELVEERSGGRIKVDVYGNSQLGDERSILESLQMGTIEMGIITSGALSGFVPSFAIVDLGYLINSKEEAKTLFASEVGQALSQQMADAGILNLGDVSCGFRSVYTTKPIQTVADIKGMTIRTMENPAHMACFTALGANPVPMAWGELYTALQQGTVDGAENVPDMYYNSKHFEVAKEFNLTEHVYLVVMWMCSKSFYEKLPADLQQLVMECAQESIAYEEELYDESEATIMDKLAEAGVHVNTVDKEAFRAQVISSWDKSAASIQDGPENLAKMKDILGLS